jgi:hypothetical protein
MGAKRAAATAAADPPGGFIGELVEKMKRNFTVPSDDANFDPPKFKGWAGRPEVMTVYGMSSVLFFPTGLLLLYLAAAGVATEAMMGWAWTWWIEGPLLICVSATSLHGDVILMGKRSYWHVADRCTAQCLFAVKFLQIYFFVMTASPPMYLCAVIALCYFFTAGAYSQSFIARDWDPYIANHIVWHVVCCVNILVVTMVMVVFGGPSTEDARMTAGAIYVVGFALQIIWCVSVWTREYPSGTNGVALNGKASNAKASNGKAANGKTLNGKALNGKAW